jgi:hypothetical protein
MAYGASAQAFDTKRSEGDMISCKMAKEKVYKGTLMDVQADGYVGQIADTNALIFAGVAAETKDNSAGSDGDLNIDIYVNGIFTFKTTGADITWVGKLAYADLANLDAGQRVLATTGGTNPVVVGRIVEFVDSTHVRVRINGFAFGAGAAPNGIHS